MNARCTEFDQVYWVVLKARRVQAGYLGPKARANYVRYGSTYRWTDARLFGIGVGEGSDGEGGRRSGVMR